MNWTRCCAKVIVTPCSFKESGVRTMWLGPKVPCQWLYKLITTWAFGTFVGASLIILSNMLFSPIKSEIFHYNLFSTQVVPLVVEGYCCNRVEVMGMYNSGTNWLSYVLRANLEDISVTFKEEPGSPYPFETSPLYKHSHISHWNLLHDKPFLVEDTFFVVIVKNPAAWIRSLSNRPYGLTQTFLESPPWSIFRWSELENTRLTQTGTKGESGLFLLEDYDKPLLLRVSETRSDRVMSHDRETDLWVVFPNAVEAWIDFHTAWYMALDYPQKKPFRRRKVRENFTVHVINKTASAKRHFNPPKGWHGVFVSYEALLNDTDVGFARLEKVIRANVRSRDLHMEHDDMRPSRMGKKGKSSTWEQSTKGLWMMESHTPLSGTNYNEAIKKYLKSQYSGKMEMKVKDMTAGIAAKLGVVYVT